MKGDEGVLLLAPHASVTYRRFDDEPRQMWVRHTATLRVHHQCLVVGRQWAEPGSR